MSTKISDNKKIILEVKESGSSLLNDKVNATTQLTIHSLYNLLNYTFMQSLQV